MSNLNFPAYPIREKTIDNTQYIWDIVRKKWFVKQPEEWVRQHLIWYLIHNLSYPKSLMSVEKQVTVNKLKKRYDLLVFNNELDMLLLVECKAPNVEISQETFNQIASYNFALKVPFLLVTNGIKHFFCKIDRELNKVIFLKEILPWDSLIEHAKDDNNEL